MTSWVVALEVGEDPDGPALDAAAMARRMEAVGDIRPTAYGKGQRRHSFLLRMDGQTATDAVVSAISRFHESSVGGALIGARVVRPADGAPLRAATTVAAPVTAPAPALRPKVVAVAVAVLVVGAGLIAVGGVTYVQSAWIDVQHLDPGGRVDLLLAWFGPGENLLSYEAVPVAADGA